MSTLLPSEKLERGLGLTEAVALNMNAMVGIGPFIVIPLVIQAMGGPQGLLAGVGGRSRALVAGRPGVGRAGRSDAARRRHVRISARGLWSWAGRAIDVIPVHLADADSGAARGGLGRDRFLAISHVSGSARCLSKKSCIRRAGRCTDRPSLPQDRRDRPDFEVSLGRRRRHDTVDDLGRGDALLRANGV